jgi:hypothetical protein
VCRVSPEADRLVLRGQKATGATVKEGINFGEEKLFSCHGLFAFGDVERSGLLPASGGRLAVPDVVPLDRRRAWLVVMSACERRA